MPRAHSNGIELEYDTFGDPSDPALLLVMGFTAQMTAWDEELCKLLVDEGLYVIRFDNRDCGLSTKLDGVPVDGFFDDYRVHSDMFWIDYVSDSPLTAGQPAGTVNGVDEGYYLFLNPLEPGAHTLHFTGALAWTTDTVGFDWRFELDLTYSLTVQ